MAKLTKRRIKGGKANIPVVAPKTCPDHPAQTMVFDATEFMWKCSLPTCHRRAWPEHEAGTKPIVGKGTIHLVRAISGDGVDSYFYVQAENNVLVELNEFVDEFKVDQSLGMMYVVLAFPLDSVQQVAL